jgi:hypothetical protein
MGLSGGILLIESDALVHDVFAWVWPPALLVLVVWMFIQARRQMHSRTGRWVLYPVLAALALASVGAGYETVRESVEANVYAHARPVGRRWRAQAAPVLHRLG